MSYMHVVLKPCAALQLNAGARTDQGRTHDPDSALTTEKASMVQRLILFYVIETLHL